MKRPRAATLLARAAATAAALALAFALAAAQGAPDSTGEEEIRQRQRELDEINRQAREKREAAGRLRSQETKAVGQLRRTERELNSSQRRLRDLGRRRQSLDLQLEITRSNLHRSLDMLGDARERLHVRLRNIYKIGPARELEVLLSSRSFGQLLTRWDYLMMVAEQDRQILDSYRTRKEQVEVLEDRLRGHLEQVQRTTKQTSGENRRLSQLRSNRQGTVREIQTQREAFEAAAAELEKTARSIQRLLAQLERKRREEAEKARATGQLVAPYTGDFARGQGALDWPVSGDVVGRFGPEKHPRFGTMTLNNGIDIAAGIGTPVRSVAKGKVDYTSDDYGTYGQMIIVNHGDGYYTLYGHLSEISVSVGTEVAAGQTIGRSGDSGSLKGAVLHFEVRRGGSALNPEDWLR